jgi:anti-sigma regulatory factor (Ser/Thr protein kinase)
VNSYCYPASPTDGGAGTVTGRPAPDGRPEPRSGVSTAFHLHSSLPLAPLPTAIACARGHTTNVLSEWGMGHLADDAVLLVSELMTNALDASAVLPERPPITLRLWGNDEALIIEAWDQSPLNLEHAEAEAGADAECGRGLMVVQALSNRWGAKRVGYNRKVVWAELDVLPLPVTEAGLPLRHRVRRTLGREPDFVDHPEVLHRVIRGLKRL